MDIIIPRVRFRALCTDGRIHYADYSSKIHAIYDTSNHTHFNINPQREPEQLICKTEDGTEFWEGDFIVVNGERSKISRFGIVKLENYEVEESHITWLLQDAEVKNISIR